MNDPPQQETHEIMNRQIACRYVLPESAMSIAETLLSTNWMDQIYHLEPLQLLPTG